MLHLINANNKILWPFMPTKENQTDIFLIIRAAETKQTTPCPKGISACDMPAASTAVKKTATVIRYALIQIKKYLTRILK